jgi:aminopeptidase N
LKYNLDILAVPDYPSDAISHWGFIIFSERALLHNPSTTSEIERQRIALLVAKELAEQVRLIS